MNLNISAKKKKKNREKENNKRGKVTVEWRIEMPQDIKVRPCWRARGS